MVNLRFNSRHLSFTLLPSPGLRTESEGHPHSWTISGGNACVYHICTTQRADDIPKFITENIRLMHKKSTSMAIWYWEMASRKASHWGPKPPRDSFFGYAIHGALSWKLTGEKPPIPRADGHDGICPFWCRKKSRFLGCSMVVLFLHFLIYYDILYKDCTPIKTKLSQ